MRVLALDPGTTESAYAVVTGDYRPVEFGKIPNTTMLDFAMATRRQIDHVVIEMIGHYGTGMPAGQTTFDTCVWIGRFIQALDDFHGLEAEVIKRGPVKIHHCGSSRAKDPNVTAALVDRFTPGATNFGKGTKDQPGWFYGFAKDAWAAYAVAVWKLDQLLISNGDRGGPQVLDRATVGE